ncbi:8658_t:CDS:2, partial [Gigaspora margarita]
DEPVVMLDAPLDVVTKMDAMMKDLLESLTNDEHDISSANNEKDVFKVCEKDSDGKEIDENEDFRKRQLYRKELSKDEYDEHIDSLDAIEFRVKLMITMIKSRFHILDNKLENKYKDSQRE